MNPTNELKRKLKWKKMENCNCWRYEHEMGLFTAEVCQFNDTVKRLAYKYQIIINIGYISKDKNAYFADIDLAIQAAEMLIERVCKEILEELK